MVKGLHKMSCLHFSHSLVRGIYMILGWKTNWSRCFTPGDRLLRKWIKFFTGNFLSSKFEGIIFQQKNMKCFFFLVSIVQLKYLTFNNVCCVPFVFDPSFEIIQTGFIGTKWSMSFSLPGPFPSIPLSHPFFSSLHRGNRGWGVECLTSQRGARLWVGQRFKKGNYVWFSHTSKKHKYLNLYYTVFQYVFQYVHI